jgi:cytochrome c-type biogenesis protein CcmH/NrfG
MSATARRTRLLLIAGTVLLTAALYLAPRIKHESSPAVAAPPVVNFDSQLKKAKEVLSQEQVASASRLEASLAATPGNSASLDSLVIFWDALGQPALSGGYAEQRAEAAPSEQGWIQAAYRYFDAFQATSDSLQRNYLVGKAIRCYEAVLALNPENLDAKTDLGLCYAEGTAEPMKGILLLREVVEKNPDHENAQFNLGVLSMRSGQYAKAVERFSKVLSLNPSRTEMYYLVGKAWMMAGEKEKAIENFEKFKKSSGNTALVNETNTLIQQLNNQ